MASLKNVRAALGNGTGGTKRTLGHVQLSQRVTDDVERAGSGAERRTGRDEEIIPLSSDWVFFKQDDTHL
ncbi:hypothetical protein BaRGS_00022779 [Batillaria attramentaria]|uniref:Uncharacterized protein n=1 Tax=Batillaria attramentaria TaxID=370345 RepID=A0ABD0KFZ0_9CAEN